MKYSLYVLFFITLLSCGSDDTTPPPALNIDYTAINEQEIIDYLRINSLEAERTESGLYYTVENQGEGVMPEANSQVTVLYIGTLLNGVVFDQNTDTGISAGVSDFILGWREGLPLFNEGGSGTLFVPAHLGYGSAGVGAIPGGAVLIFDIELVAVTPIN